MKKLASLVSCCLMLTTCADDKPYLDGFIKRASDGIMTSCDPYNRGDNHTCVIFASDYAGKLFILDATAEEMVLSDMGYMPLSVKVGHGINQLAAPQSSDKQFPYFFALDASGPGVFVVRSFPDATKKVKSFSQPQFYQLPQRADNIAAVDSGNAVYAVLTHTEEGHVSVVSFDRVTGEKKALRKFKLGSKPSHVAFTTDGKKAIITDQGEKNIAFLDLSNISLVMSQKEAPKITALDVGVATDQLLVTKRDFGSGVKNYAIALSSNTRRLKLIALDDKKVISTYQLKQHPMALYVPDTNEVSCCKGESQWMAVADLKGTLSYLTIKNGKIEEAVSVDMLSKHNMALSILHVRKIIGGSVKVDESLKRKVQCSNNRKMFFISSYGMDKRSPVTEESFEVEAQAIACEGTENVSRLGYKNE